MDSNNEINLRVENKLGLAEISVLQRNNWMDILSRWNTLEKVHFDMNFQSSGISSFSPNDSFLSASQTKP